MAKTDTGLRRKGDRPQNSNYNQQEVIDAYDKMKAGEMSHQDYAWLIIQKMNKYISNMMLHWHVNPADSADVRQDCYEIILRKLDNYDPTQSRVASYFSPQITGAIRMHINDNHSAKDIVSPHYRDVLKEIKERLALKHLPTEPVSQYSEPFLIMLMGGKYRKSTIRGAVKAENADISSIEEDPTFENRGSWKDDPLTFVIKGEQHDMLVKALKRLKPVELLTVLKKLDNATFKEISDELNAHKDEYKIDLQKVWPTDVQSAFMSGLSKLKVELELEDYIERSHLHDLVDLMDSGEGDDEDDTVITDLADSFGLDLD